ncbi:MAG: hypothetical protein WBA17_13995 [Saprospiraceae bacterium]
MANKNPRLAVTLPAGIMKALDCWANKEGNRPATFAASLLESKVREAIVSGIIPPEAMEEDPAVIEPQVKTALENFLQLVGDGECPSDEEIIELADTLEIEAALLIKLCPDFDKKEKPETNGV